MFWRIMNSLENFRNFRSRKLNFLGKLLLKLNISANVLTSLSFLSGLLSVYYLFSNYTLFVLFAILHLAFDSMDGVVARLSRTSELGKYYDLVSDNLITALILIKVGYIFHPFAYIAAGLYVLSVLIHLKTKAPVLFMRTATLLLLIIATNPAFRYEITLIAFGYLGFAITSMISLTSQLFWKVIKN
jgi:phosphatidylserine synthase